MLTVLLAIVVAVCAIASSSHGALTRNELSTAGAANHGPYSREALSHLGVVVVVVVVVVLDLFVGLSAHNAVIVVIIITTAISIITTAIVLGGGNGGQVGDMIQR